MLKRQVQQAQATGDIGTILRLLSKSADLTPTDFIKKTVGSLLYVYYAYVDRFHCRPKDCDDMIDGLLFIEAQNFIERKAYKDAEMRAKQNG